MDQHVLTNSASEPREWHLLALVGLRVPIHHEFHSTCLSSSILLAAVLAEIAPLSAVARHCITMIGESDQGRQDNPISQSLDVEARNEYASCLLTRLDRGGELKEAYLS